MSDELSDEAFRQWVSANDGMSQGNRIGMDEAIREWRRRAEALIEQERTVRIRVEQMYQTLTESIETEKRKAFEACWEYADGDIKKLMSVEEAYRAYTEAAKEEK